MWREHKDDTRRHVFVFVCLCICKSRHCACVWAVTMLIGVTAMSDYRGSRRGRNLAGIKNKC